jgi:hypothetical protein
MNCSNDCINYLFMALLSTVWWNLEPKNYHTCPTNAFASTLCGVLVVAGMELVGN